MQDLLSRDGGQLPQLADSLLEVSCREMGLELSRRQLLEASREALAAIHEGERGSWGGGGSGMNGVGVASMPATVCRPVRY